MSEAVTDPKVIEEQAVLDHAAACLERMQARASEVTAVAERMVVEENTVNARIAKWEMAKRQAALAVGSGPLCFGRIDEEAPKAGAEGDRWYVGRRHIEAENGDPVVVDWRAPVSAPFYRATTVDPCGLERRRRFSIDGAELVAVFDEDLTDPDGDVAGGLPDPLLAELDRARSGQMRDIVATIAAEQDIIIRAPMEELLVVQGGPGTGKTAVGLHRAAFLLFQHRSIFEESGVLVVGPNPVFLRYISDVLPSLGETSVIQATLDGLLGARLRVRGQDDEVVARLKGDERMAEVIGRAIRQRISVPAEGLEMRSGVVVVRFTAEEVTDFQERALARRLPVQKARDVFRQILLQEAWRRYAARPGTDPAAQPSFVGAAKADATFKKVFDKMWPTMSGGGIVRDLLTKPRTLAAAAKDIIAPEDQALLRRKAAKKLSDEEWTPSDLPLIDEANERCVGVAATYQHVVVDEAQDHSSMALRALGRRAKGLSMTVLGDLAQATSPGAMRSWEDAVAALRGASSVEDPTVRVAELTVGYRVPASILDVANRLLPHAAPGVTPAASVRPGGAPPLLMQPPVGERASAIIAEIRTLREATASVGVIGVPDHLDELEASLEANDLPFDRVGRRSLPGADAVALLDPDQAKGLEFDAVIVVEPNQIAGLENGERRLYVALTRSTQFLGIVGPTPPALELATA